MPAYGALNSSFTVNGVVHDPLTGLDTGSGNDRITTGLGEDNFTTGAGGDSFNCDDILLGHGAIGYEMQAGMGISANARGKTTGTIAALQIDTGSGNDRFMGLDTGSGNDRLTGNDIWSPAPACVPFMSEPGATSYPTGVDHLGQFGHEADHFTNFAMPVGNFI